MHFCSRMSLIKWFFMSRMAAIETNDTHLLRSVMVEWWFGLLVQESLTMCLNLNFWRRWLTDWICCDARQRIWRSADCVSCGWCQHNWTFCCANRWLLFLSRICVWVRSLRRSKGADLSSGLLKIVTRHFLQHHSSMELWLYRIVYRLKFRFLCYFLS